MRCPLEFDRSEHRPGFDSTSEGGDDSFPELVIQESIFFGANDEKWAHRVYYGQTRVTARATSRAEGGGTHDGRQTCRSTLSISVRGPRQAGRIAVPALKVRRRVEVG